MRVVRYFIIATLLAVPILAFTLMVVVEWLFWPSPERRFPLPQGTSLTEESALALTKEALVADRGSLSGMYPVPYRDGRPPAYFAANGDRTGGYVRWMVDGTMYGVTIEKHGDEAVCRKYTKKGEGCQISEGEKFP